MCKIYVVFAYIGSEKQIVYGRSFDSCVNMFLCTVKDTKNSFKGHKPNNVYSLRERTEGVPQGLAYRLDIYLTELIVQAYVQRKTLSLQFKE